MEEKAIAAIARDRADWLLDAIACALQDRSFLRGELEYNAELGEVIKMNAEKAITVAINKFCQVNQKQPQ